MIFYPIEDLFLRFNTAEDSFNYSNLKGYHLITIEDEGCAFLYNLNGDSSMLHTVTKHENGWGITDAQCERKTFKNSLPLNTTDFDYFCLDGMTIKNTEVGKTLLKVSGVAGDVSTDEFYDTDGRKYKPLYRPSEINNKDICIGYYTIFEGDIPDSVTFNFDNKEYTIYK